MSEGTARETIGFIGLGLMGTPMIANLLRDGYPVRVYNRTAAKAEALVAQGAVRVERAEEVVEPGGILLSCLANDAALEEIFQQNPGLFTRLGPQGVHVSISTIAPDTAHRLAQEHATRGGCYVAAPVMGRPDAVAARGQTYLVSGPAAAVARVRPILAGLGRAVYEFGDEPATAHVAKLSLNFLIAASIEAMAEAFTLARKSGLEPAALHRVFAETMFACPIYQNYGRIIFEEAYREPMFRLSLGLKDMKLVAQQAEQAEVPMPLARLLCDRYLAALAHGRGDWDWTSIAAEVAADAGL